MFLRLCGPPSIPLSFTVALCGLPGYLILFDTRTFEHERQLRTGRLPSLSEFLVISMHFTATPRIPPAPTALKPPSFNRNTGLSPALSRLT